MDLVVKQQVQGPSFGEQLVAADGFVDVASAVCVHVRNAFAIAPCAIALHHAGGGPAILVDTFADTDDLYRLATVSPHLYALNPMYRALRDANAARDEEVDARTLADFARRHAFTGEYGHTVVLPLMAPGGVVGSIQCGRREAYSFAIRRELVTMATQVSVRLAQLGVSAIPAAPARPGISPRQYQAARLVARGASNAEIADALSISTNTVKKLLKEVFLRLGAHNRTELATGFAAIAACWEIPVGITRTGAVTITRGM
jgi:DNA-binding CsgD family transcriptional regulator